MLNIEGAALQYFYHEDLKFINKNWFSIFLFTGAKSCATRLNFKNRAAPTTFRMRIEQPLNAFEIKLIIRMVSEPNQKNFKGK
jgi:hypothetical protein